MNIERFKIDHGEITVDYSGFLESFRIATMDEAKASLYTAAANVAILARTVLCLDIEGAAFNAIAFSNGNKPGTRIILTVPTAEGETAKIACPKIAHARESNPDTFEIIRDHPQTLYYEAVEKLKEEIVEFVKGKRLQMALPFDQTPEERKLNSDYGRLFAESMAESSRVHE